MHEKRGQCDKEHTEQGCALKSTDADSGRVALPKRSRCKSEAFLHTFFAGKKYGMRSGTIPPPQAVPLPLHKGGLDTSSGFAPLNHLPLKGKALGRVGLKGGRHFDAKVNTNGIDSTKFDKM